MNESMQFLMQLRLDTDEAMRELVEVIDRFKQDAAKGVRLKVKTDLDLAGIKAEVDKLRGQMAEIGIEVEKVEEEFKQLDATGTKALERLRKKAPGLAKDLETAFEKGEDAARQTFDRMLKSADAFKQKLKQKDPLAGLKSVMGSEDVKGVTTVLAKYTQATRELRRLKSDIAKTKFASDEELARATRAVNVAAGNRRLAGREMRARFGGDTELARRALTEFRKAVRGDPDPQAQRVDKLVQSITTAFDATLKKRERQGTISTLRGQRGTIAQELDAYLRRGTGRGARRTAAIDAAPTAGRPGAPGGSIRVEADPEHLIASIRQILLTPVFHAKVEAHASHLIDSVRETLALIGRTGGMKIRLDTDTGRDAGQRLAALAAAQQATGEAGRIPASRRRRTPQERLADRERELVSQSERLTAQGYGHNPRAAAAFLSTAGVKEFLPPDFLSKVQTILKYYDGTAKTPDELATRARAALTVLEDVKQGFNAFATSDASLQNKELVKRFGIGFNAEFLTGLARRAREVRDQGPARDPRGGLAGVDFAGQSVYADQWAERYREIMRRTNRFSAYRGDLDTREPGDEWREQEKAYLDYRRTVQRYERAALALGRAQTVEDQRAAYRRLEGRRQELSLAEDVLATSVLGARGTIGVNGRQLGKGGAYLAAQRNLQTFLGGGLDLLNTGRGASTRVDFDDYTRRVFSGDREATTALLRAQGASEELLADERKRAALLEEQLGPLRQMYDLWDKLEDEMRKAVASVAQLRRINSLNPRTIASAQERALRDNRLFDLYGTSDRVALRAQYGGRTLDPDLAFRQAQLEARRRDERADSLRRRRAQDQGRALRDDRFVDLYGTADRDELRRMYGNRVLDPDIAYAQAMQGLGAPRRGRGVGEAGYGNAIRNGFALFGGFELGFTAVNGIRNSMRRYMEFQQEIAGIQGVLPGRNRGDALNIGAGVGQVASKYGVSLLEAAQAARVLAQSGVEAKDVVKELDYTFQATRGMGMTTSQAQDLQVAIRAVTMENERFAQGINYTVAVMDKISAVEAKYAVESKDLADAITLLSPIVSQFADGMTGLTDVFDQTNGMATVLVSRLRITGTAAANAIKQMFSRLARPEVLNTLTQKFGAQIGGENGDLLPLDQLLPALGRRYEELQASDPLKAKQFATALAGGHRSNTITALLQNYVQVQDIATESSYAWGGSAERAAIATDTLSTAAARARTNFDLFTANMLNTSAVGQGLKSILENVADVMGGLGGTGAGSLTAIAAVLGAGAAFKGGRGLYRVLAGATESGADVFGVLTEQKRAGRVARGLGSIASSSSKVAPAVRGLGSALGALAGFFTPGGVLIAGALAATAAIGGIAAVMDDADEKANRYRVTVKSLEELRIWDSPQMANFQNLTTGRRSEGGLGYGRVETAYADISRAATSQPIQNLIADFKRAAEEAGVSFDKFRQENPKKVEEFRRRFAEIFIEQLPADVRAGFTQIESETERIKRVSEAVGGAAFAANVQIANAIDQVRAATNRMVADGVEGINKIDSAGRKSLFARASGKVMDLLGAPSLQRTLVNRGPASMDVFGTNYTEVQLALRQIPNFAELADSELGRTEIQRILRRQLAARGDETTVGAILEEMFQIAEWSPDSYLGRAVQEATTRQVDPVGSVAMREQLYGRESLSQGDRLRAIYTRVGEAMGNRAAQAAQERLDAQRPEAEGLRTSDRLLRGATGTEGLGIGTQGATVALARFEDSLLDLVVTIYQRVRQLRQDEQFSTRFGLGFDRGQAGLGLARELDNQLNAFSGDRQVDLLKLRRDLETLAGRRFEVSTPGDGTRRDQSQRRAQEIGVQIGDRQAELARFASESIRAVLGDSSAGQSLFSTLVADLQALFGTGVVPALSAIDGWLRRLADGIGRQSKDLINDNASRLQNLQLEEEVARKVGELREASLPVTASLAARLAAQAGSAQQLYLAERATLQEKIRQGTEDEDALKRQLQLLDANYRLNAAYKARTDLASAERALTDQRRTNIEGMLSGFRALAGDRSIWEAILNPEGETPEERARVKAAAIRDVIFNTISPVFDTLYQRLVDNVFAGLTDSLAGSLNLGDLLDSPELRLRQDVEMARGMLVTTGTQVGDTWQQAMMSAGLAVADMWTQALGFGTRTPVAPGTPFNPFDLSAPLSGGPRPFNPFDLKQAITPDMLAMLAEEQAKKMRTRALISGAGMMIGNVGGTLVGGGGRGAQMGSSIGSTVGMLGAASLAKLGGSWGALGGPIGMAVGAAVGGLLGGLLGGKDDEQVTPPVIKSLDAIERAQRDTITTIAAQTDALLKPESRFFNMPATFVAPGYAPTVGPGAGGGSRSLSIGSVQVNVPAVAAGVSPEDIGAAIEKAMANVLNAQRLAGAW